MRSSGPTLMLETVLGPQVGPQKLGLPGGDSMDVTIGPDVYREDGDIYFAQLIIRWVRN